MRKNILMAFALMICNLSVCTQVGAAPYNVISSKNNFNLYDYNEVELSRELHMINNVKWTGKEYIYRKRRNQEYMISTDFAEWKSIEIKDKDLLEILFTQSPYIINYWNNQYISYDRMYEVPGEILGLIENNGAQPTSYIYILNPDLETVHKETFEEPITNVTCVGDRYYCQTMDYSGANNKGMKIPISTIYVSKDGVTWEKDATLTECPLTNGIKNTLIFEGEFDWDKREYNRIVKQIADINDINKRWDVVFEEAPATFFALADDVFISYSRGDSNPFKISMDGIYWLDVDYPSEYNMEKHIGLSSKIVSFLKLRNT